MDEKILTAISEEMVKLPLAQQKAINAFDWLRKCQEIGDDNNLSYEDIHYLKTEAVLVLMGLSDSRQLYRYIDNEIGGTGWQNIHSYIMENIVTPVGKIMSIIVEYDG